MQLHHPRQVKDSKASARKLLERHFDAKHLTLRFEPGGLCLRSVSAGLALHLRFDGPP